MERDSRETRSGGTGAKRPEEGKGAEGARETEDEGEDEESATMGEKGTDAGREKEADAGMRVERVAGRWWEKEEAVVLNEREAGRGGETNL